MSSLRYGGRAHDVLRPVKISFNSFGYAAGTVLFEMGRTKVLCAITMQNKVPSFLKGKKRGWLTAEYAMLPTATSLRTQRESTTMRKNGRSQEISRLIGRALRTIVNFEALGERTILVDCDVLQADAGTRTACITGASIALQEAQKYWLQRGVLSAPILTDSIAALSVGWVGQKALLDLDFSEDSIADADFNVVMNRAGNMVEFQGSAEGATLTWDQFEQVRACAVKGIHDLFNECDKLIAAHDKRSRTVGEKKKTKESSFFSLGNRQQSETP